MISSWFLLSTLNIISIIIRFHDFQQLTDDRQTGGFILLENGLRYIVYFIITRIRNVNFYATISAADVASFTEAQEFM